MEFLFRLSQYQASIFACLLIFIVSWYVFAIRGNVVYRYSLASQLHKRGLTSSHPRSWILAGLRCMSLILMALLVGQPQWIDPRSKLTVQGIDIVLALDVSGSMELPHCEGDDRSRIAVAKKEALRFVDKRDNDALGLIIFGNDALSRCPLTADKTMLRACIADTNIGFVDPRGTVLSTGILTAINRLKTSTAKSKIIIVLTDGEPSDHDIDPKIAIESAKQLGIKIYTVGIADNQVITISDPIFGRRPYQTRLNKALLSRFARETGGEFFQARSADDMRRIYDTIDTLEKTEIEAPIFSRTYEWFMPFLWLLFTMIMLELFLSSYLWFGI